MPGYIHHIEWCVTDLEVVERELVLAYGFRRVASRHHPQGYQSVISSGSTVFLLTRPEMAKKDTHEQTQIRHWLFFMILLESQLNCYKQLMVSYFSLVHSHSLNLQIGNCPTELPPEDVYPFLSCCRPASHTRDSLFNVCLQVGCVDSVVSRCKAQGVQVLIEPRTLSHGLRYACIKSIVGNIVHSIISIPEHSQHRFLPGFKDVPSEAADMEEPLTSHLDHVTYVCNTGESQGILDWYKRCFGMERFLVNPMEDPEEGVVIGEEVGMRMKVGEWLSSWLCREEGVQFPDADSDALNFKLVLAEPLKADSDSHVQKFLDDHGGPGLQHLGLVSTRDIVFTVEAMGNRGAQFRRPPPTYYKMTSKMSEIRAAGCSLPDFERLGLLLDSEADTEANGTSDCASRNLIQIFSKPLFLPKDTFFLEVLERRGARGFGAGNITALARSIQLHQEELQRQRASSAEAR